ncbi:MAG: Crp/Fnr family transcriptional regulator [Bacteroidales bacterium]|nr:Crp/Fnr family transcriptional regulator [Bacteroidales bacterium]
MFLSKHFEIINEIENLLIDLNRDTKEILEKICSYVPSLMSYSEICKCEIKHNQVIYKCEDFKKTELKLTVKEKHESNEIEINVYYIKPIVSEKPIFKNEEILILKTVAKRILSFLSYKSSINSIKKTVNSDTENYNVDLIKYLKTLCLKDNEVEIFLKKPIYFKKGETISKQKTNVNYIFLIEHGYVKLTCENLYSHNFIIKIAKGFEFVGLSLLFNTSYQIFTINALTDSKVYFIERNEFERITRENSKFSHSIIELLSSNILFLIDRMNKIATKQAFSRVCDTLLYLSDEVFCSQVIEGFISRKDISELSALSTENTVRILSDLKEMKVIDTLRNEIHILQKQKLIELSNRG